MKIKFNKKYKRQKYDKILACYVLHYIYLFSHRYANPIIRNGSKPESRDHYFNGCMCHSCGTRSLTDNAYSSRQLSAGDYRSGSCCTTRRVLLVTCLVALGLSGYVHFQFLFPYFDSSRYKS
jgi:hypothetical protein